MVVPRNRVYKNPSVEAEGKAEEELNLVLPDSVPAFHLLDRANQTAALPLQ
jgi:hypothetical protein